MDSASNIPFASRSRGDLRRERFIVRGQVQGVGFRPFVFTLAEEFSLTGFVRNSPRGVVIEIQGLSEDLEAFAQSLVPRLPPLARVTALERESLPPLPDEDSFAIAKSTEGEAHAVLISPDTAVCADCLADMRSGRRFRYPFTNCTNCGPRYTITRSIPYDRPATSMACFPLCEDCRKEYENPRDRRFHAQPNACPVCGPRVWFVRKGDEETMLGAPPQPPRPTGDAALRDLAEFLAGGGIAAVKGLGGFHLACNAADAGAVELLRQRKARPHKPFALMAPDLEEARRLAHVSPEAEALLVSPEHPIVLCPRRTGAGLAPGVSPDTAALGLMLPYTPLHRVLLDHYAECLRKREQTAGTTKGQGGCGSPAALVMTSGNRGGEPICLGNREALRDLADMADAWLLHNRDILIRVDDSVVRPVPGLGEIRYRRARGYVPRPTPLPELAEGFPAAGEKKPPVVLGVGAELKNTLCLTKGDDAFVSQHIGDMANLETAAFHREIRDHLERLLMVRPEAVVRDLHPDYLSSALAEDSGLPSFTLQHHFAHAHAVLAENRHRGPALVLALDGTGLGDDGALWGGEFLYVDNTPGGAENSADPRRGFSGKGSGFEAGRPGADGSGAAGPVHRRLAHLAPMFLPGGEAAIREPWRIAHALLLGLGLPPREEFLPWLPEHAATTALLPAVLARRVNTPVSTSCGRLFDAVAALLGLCSVTSYEGQAAIRLEEAQGPDAGENAQTGLSDRESAHRGQDAYPCPEMERDARPRPERPAPSRQKPPSGRDAPSLLPSYAAPGCRVLDTHSLFAAVYDDVLRKVPAARAARRFHAGLAAGLADMAAGLAAECGVRRVGLSGGCLQNATLALELVRLLRARGLEPLTHRLLPPGDACISLGQAAYGRLLL